MSVTRNIEAMRIDSAQAEKNLTIAVHGKTTVGKYLKSLDATHSLFRRANTGKKEGVGNGIIWKHPINRMLCVSQVGIGLLCEKQGAAAVIVANLN